MIELSDARRRATIQKLGKWVGPCYKYEDADREIDRDTERQK